MRKHPWHILIQAAIVFTVFLFLNGASECNSGDDDTPTPGDDDTTLLPSPTPGCSSTTETGAQCSDGMDNDCDGLVDGQDPDCETLRFVVTCDSRGSDNGVNSLILGEIVQETLDLGASFLLFPGDLVDGSGGASSLEQQLTYWRDIVQPLYDAGVGVYPVRGNHDDGSVDAWNAVFSGPYALPQNGPAGELNLTWSTTYGNVMIAGVDVYVNDARVNVDWLQAQLDSSDASFYFVIGHEPAYAVHHSDCLDDHPADRDDFVATLLDAGARTYFAGHDHFYDHARIDDGDGNTGNDLHQFVVGTAGAPLYDWSGDYDGNNGAMTPVNVYHEAEYGFLLGEVQGDTATLTWWHRTGKGRYEPTSDVFALQAAH